MNARRGWGALVDAEPVKWSPLQKETHRCVWATATNQALKGHLKRVVLSMPPSWFFRVVTDAQLMDAWLAKNLDEDEIIDVDVRELRRAKRQAFSSLSSLTDPPALLIIRLGIKAARNSAMSEVLLETINTRDHANQPTWLVDHPDHRLAPGHLAYDDLVKDVIQDWPKIDLLPEGSTVIKKRPDPKMIGVPQTLSDVMTPSEKNGSITHSVLDKALAKHNGTLSRKEKKRQVNGGFHQ